MNTSEISSSFLSGGERWPPGFRFHPTDEELVLYWLKKKICHRRLEFDAIAEFDVYKADPDELPGLSRLKTGDRQWFFFSPRDRKYPNGGRTNRATRLGFWKATGKDRSITCNSRSVGTKKTLVFYKGRAPSGERTDWVMHEYTLNEEELKRCTAQDYYALYKIFKKSGAGPKNGEQYGAHFREEDWADDEKAIDSVDKEQVTPLQQFSQNDTSLNGIGINCQAESQINGIEFLNRVVDDPLFEPISEPSGTVQAAAWDEDVHCTLVEKSLVETNVQERAFIIPPCGQFNVTQPCFNPTQSTSSQFGDTSKVACATSMNRQRSHESEEFIEGFLEIDDLIWPEPAKQNIENPVDELAIGDFDGFGELDLFQDVSMFLQDVGGDSDPASYIYHSDVGNQLGNPIPFPFPDNLENVAVNHIPDSCFNGFQTEMVQPISQPYHNAVANETVYQFNYPMPPDPDVVNQPWMHNQNSSITTAAVPNQESVIPPTSGVVYTGVNENQFRNQNRSQNQNGDGNEGGESWFSSTLWSFVETIPTTPASATESTALVNKAFSRLSSFGRRGVSMKVSRLNTSTNAGDLAATRYNRGLLLFSLLGVLCAVLWVFTGTSTREYCVDAILNNN